MRKLLLQMQLSIDGFVADNDGNTDWMVWSWGSDWTWDAELQKYHNNLAASVDCILLSNNMAEEGFIDHWASMAKSKDNPQSEFATSITKASKVVFSNRQTTAWDNTTFIYGDLSEEVTKLKNTPGGTIVVYGGARFASSLIAAKLVDEFHFVINPTILGDGFSIFNKLSDRQQLSLIDSMTYSDGIIVSKYKK